MPVTLLTGKNSYAAHRALAEIIADHAAKHPVATPERFDGSALEPRDLPDLLTGTSLFADYRLVIVRDAGAHKALWNALEDYVGRIADSTTVVFVEPAADKRTRTYKALQKVATVRDFPEAGPRDAGSLAAWLVDEGAARGVSVPRDSARLIVERVGYDGWALSNALEKLAVIGDASPARVRDLIEPSPDTSAFEIFEYALKGRDGDVRTTLIGLRATQDPHALVGLLAGQAFQLALVANSKKSPAELAKLVGGHPYPLQKMGQMSRTLTRATVRRAVAAIAECDRDLKHSVAEPWVLIERALTKISVLS